MSEPAGDGPQQPPLAPPTHAPAWAPPGPPPPASAGRRPLIIALSAISVLAVVAAIVLGVLYAQAASGSDSLSGPGGSSERAIDDHAVSVANTVAQSISSAPSDGNWTAWQANLCGMADGDFRTMACSASTVGQYQQLKLQSVATIWSSGVAARTPTTRVVLVVTAVTGGSALAPTVTSRSQVTRITVDTTTWKVQKLEVPS